MRAETLAPDEPLQLLQALGLPVPLLWPGGPLLAGISPVEGEPAGVEPDPVDDPAITAPAALAMSADSTSAEPAAAAASVTSEPAERTATAMAADSTAAVSRSTDGTAVTTTSEATERTATVEPLAGRRRRRSVRARRLGVAGTVAAVALLWVLTAVTLGGGEIARESAELVASATTTTATTAPAAGSDAAGPPPTEAPPDESAAPESAGAALPPDTTVAAPDTTVAAPPPPPVVTAPPTTEAPRTRSTLPGSDAPSSGGQRTAAAPAGAPVIGRIAIPAIGLSTTLYQGGELAQIDRGPSHMPTTAMPGRQGNTVIAGHRTTKTHPFRDLDRLTPGDTVIFEVSYGTYTYEFTHHTIVTEDDVYILDQDGGNRATLFACHPKGSSQYRIVAHFRLVSAPAASPTTTAKPPTSQPIGSLPGRR